MRESSFQPLTPEKSASIPNRFQRFSALRRNYSHFHESQSLGPPAWFSISGPLNSFEIFIARVANARRRLALLFPLYSHPLFLFSSNSRRLSTLARLYLKELFHPALISLYSRARALYSFILTRLSYRASAHFGVSSLARSLMPRQFPLSRSPRILFASFLSAHTHPHARLCRCIYI